jgi:hypothetical protein
MSQNAQQAFIELGRFVTGTQKGAQQPLVSGESAFDLPSLSVDFVEESFFHLSAVFGLGPLQGISSASRNHSGADAQNVPAQDMIMLGIVSGVAQDLIPTSFRCSLTQNGSKLRRVLRRSPTDEGTGEQVSTGMTSNAEFRPSASVETFVASAPDVVTTDVTAFQTRGIDCNLRPSANELALTGSTKYNF